MDLRIAGLVWRLSFADREAEEICRSRYERWTTDPGVPSLATIDLTLTAANFVPPEIPPGREPEEVRVLREGATFDLRRLDLRGSLDLRDRRGTLFFAGTPGALQSFLRVASALFLAPLGGVLVHASSVVRDGRAFLFVGVSGAGKTTIARLSVPSLILSDEVSALVPNERGVYACHSTPFWGDLADDPTDTGRDENGLPVPLREMPAAAPLARILFPVQDTSDAVVPVNQAHAFAILLREAFAFGDDEPTMQAITSSCGDVVSRVPAGDLHFRKTPAFWARVEEWARD